MVSGSGTFDYTDGRREGTNRFIGGPIPRNSICARAWAVTFRYIAANVQTLAGSTLRLRSAGAQHAQDHCGNHRAGNHCGWNRGMEAVRDRAFTAIAWKRRNSAREAV